MADTATQHITITLPRNAGMTSVMLHLLHNHHSDLSINAPTTNSITVQVKEAEDDGEFFLQIMPHTVCPSYCGRPYLSLTSPHQQQHQHTLVVVGAPLRDIDTPPISGFLTKGDAPPSSHAVWCWRATNSVYHDSRLLAEDVVTIALLAMRVTAAPTPFREAYARMQERFNWVMSKNDYPQEIHLDSSLARRPEWPDTTIRGWVELEGLASPECAGDGADFALSEDEPRRERESNASRRVNAALQQVAGGPPSPLALRARFRVDRDPASPFECPADGEDYCF
ncbi:hypothetical protein GGR50DRAFT_695718 [Xylaria sp. CBS 124048]|nr:hypothetical protein GGR50DRAFT_695718 [Xylaria sp. CBS 124048]